MSLLAKVKKKENTILLIKDLIQMCVRPVERRCRGGEEVEEREEGEEKEEREGKETRGTSVCSVMLETECRTVYTSQEHHQEKVNLERASIAFLCLRYIGVNLRKTG